MEGLLDKRIELLKKVCEESMIPFQSIAGSVIDKSGMTDLMDIFRKKR